MPGNTYPINATFARGELTPYLHGRVDIDHYQMGLAECVNWWVLPFGGLERRSGSRFVAEIKDSSKQVRLIPFEFSTEQSYILEFGDLYIRFYAAGGRIEDPPGTPYEIVSPWTEAELYQLDFSGTGDVLFIATGDRSKPIHELRRAGDTDWTLVEHVTKDGPFLPQTFASTTLTTDETGDYVPYIAGEPAFDRNNNTTVAGGGTVSGSVQHNRAAGAAAIQGYSLVAAAADAATCPVTWTFEGSNDGVTWTVLHAVTNETGWVRNERRDFFLDRDSPQYSWIRFVWTAVNGSNSSGFAQLRVMMAASEITASITASSTDGINDGAGFVASDVGRQIRLQGDDTQWRWGTIKTVVSATEVTTDLHGPVYPSITNNPPVPTLTWRMGAWSETTGYPSEVRLFKNRLYSASTKQQPLNVWATSVLTTNDHGISSPVLDTDALDVAIFDGESGAVTWLAESYRDLLISTDARQRSLSSADGTAISPDNVDQNSETKYKASWVKPLSIGNTTIFADKARRRLRELGLAPDIDGYRGPDLSLMSEHLFRGQVNQLAYQEDPYPIILAAVEDGRLPAMTYEPDQQIAGAGQLHMGGVWGNYDYGKVESVEVISNVSGEDEIWLVVARTIESVTRRYVEYIAPRFEQTINGTILNTQANKADVIDGEFFDSALRYSGPPVSSLGGLTHLIGETVGILADGLDIGDAVVQPDGTIAFPEGFEASEVCVGLRYRSRGITLRKPTHGNPDGGGMGRSRYTGGIFIDVLNTGHLEAGTIIDGVPDMQDVVVRPTSGHLGDPTPLVTGMVEMLDVNDTNDNEGVIIFETDKGLPAVVRMLQTQIQGEP